MTLWTKQRYFPTYFQDLVATTVHVGLQPTALVNVISDIIEVKDKDRLTSLIQLDLPHDFDSISHEILMAKMSYYGYSHVAVGWVKS